MSTRRKRIGKGIYRDKYGLSATVKIGTGETARQRDKRFSFDTPLREIKDWQRDVRADLGRSLGRSSARARGTLSGDARAYLPQVQTLTSTSLGSAR
jgi:hypothetical protein